MATKKPRKPAARQPLGTEPAPRPPLGTEPGPHPRQEAGPVPRPGVRPESGQRTTGTRRSGAHAAGPVKATSAKVAVLGPSAPFTDAPAGSSVQAAAAPDRTAGHDSGQGSGQESVRQPERAGLPADHKKSLPRRLGAPAFPRPVLRKDLGRKKGRPDAAGGPDGPAGGAAEGTAGGATVLSFPEPPHRRRRRHWLTGILVTVTVVAALMAVLVFSPLLAIRNVQVAGNVLAPADQVLAALAPLEGRPLPQVGGAEVLRLLAEQPAVQSVTLEAKPPETLVVHLQERQPVALLQTGNVLTLVDESGVRLATVQDRSAARLPVIDGARAPSDGPVFAAITAVLAVLPADVRSRLDVASAASIDSVELTLVDGKTVLWGNSRDAVLKAQVLEALLKEEDEESPATVYDVSTPRQPVTR